MDGGATAGRAKRSTALRAAIVQLTHEGVGRQAIAARLGCPVSYVAYVRALTGMTKHGPSTVHRPDVVQVMLSDVEREQLQRFAQELGVSMSHALRTLITQAATPTRSEA